MPMNVSSRLLSCLGSPNSKVPLAVKDVFNSAGYTYYSYDAGGKIEAKDRLFDEVSTGAVWLFGIPLYQKLIDKTLFKACKISPSVDYRVIKDKNYFKKALEYSQDEIIKRELKNAGNHFTKTKNLNFIKFALSLALTMASYFALTKFKQSMTKKSIEKEFKQKQNQKAGEKQTSYDNIRVKQSPVFSEFSTKDNNSKVSFGSLKTVCDFSEEFILNPIKNMFILDCAISGQRIVNSRNKEERKEYIQKEGAFLFFVYGADKLIKKGINFLSGKLLKTPIDLDAKFYNSDLAQNMLENDKIKNSVKEFLYKFENNSNPYEIYDFILKNQNNPVVEAAKKSDIISVLKDGNSIDTRKFIDLKQMKKLAKNLEKYIEAGSSSKNINSYLTKVKAFKIVSTLLNVGICCAALGIIVPKTIYNNRQKQQNGSSAFHVQEEYEKQLRNGNNIT